MGTQIPSPRPSRLTPANLFTMLRVALVPVVALLVAQDGDTARWWALAVFLFAALTDLFDGYVARRTSGGVTDWGALADPLADKLLILGVLVILAVSAEVPWWVVGVIAVREVGVTIQRSILSRRNITMPADRFGKWKTVSQMAYVSAVLAPTVGGALVTVLQWIAVALTVGSGLSYARRGLSG